MELLLGATLPLSSLPWAHVPRFSAPPSVPLACPRLQHKDGDCCDVFRVYRLPFSNNRNRNINSNISFKLTKTTGRRKPQIRMALISPDSGQALFSIMTSCAAFGQAMEAKTKWGSRLSAPLIALLVGMALSGTGIVPTTSPCYDFVCSSLMPMAVALCLLEADVQGIFMETGLTLKAFWYGALGTVMGTLVSYKIVGQALGNEGWKIASCLCASYIGGTINYAATAQALGISSASLVAAGMAADNLAMAAYFAVIMSIPDESDKSDSKIDESISPQHNNSAPTVETIGLSLAAAAVACTMGNILAAFLPASFTGSGLAITALITSCFGTATVLFHKKDQACYTNVFAGSQILGSTLMLLYFSVVGASAGFQEAFIGGWPLLVFIFILLSVHLGVTVLLGSFSKIPMRMMLIASNANIGGSGTAAAMANCRGWKELVKPAVLVGTLGYMIGTGVGCVVGIHLLQHMIK